MAENDTPARELPDDDAGHGDTPVEAGFRRSGEDYEAARRAALDANELSAAEAAHAGHRPITTVEE